MGELRVTDGEAIRSVIATYQEAGRLGSRELYRRAFHPDAMVCYPSAVHGILVAQPIEAFAAEVAEMVEGGTIVEEMARDLRVDVAGDVASARVDFRLRLGPDWYEGTNFLSLARIGKRWLITHKLYAMSPIGDETG